MKLRDSTLMASQHNSCDISIPRICQMFGERISNIARAVYEHCINVSDDRMKPGGEDTQILPMISAWRCSLTAFVTAI